MKNIRQGILPLCDLEVKGVSKQIHDFRIDADFSVRVGERIALVGPSGSGKTTLLRILAGLEKFHTQQDRGKIWIGSEDVTQALPQKREMGFIFQDQALFSHLNVMDNITFGLRMRGVPRKTRENEAREWLEKVNLQSKADSSIENLSGGEKQRIAWIRALIWRPRVVLLDEPFSALDLALRDVLRRELVELHRIWPAPLLLVTHDEADIHALATGKMELTWNETTAIRRVVRIDSEDLMKEK